MEYRRAPADEGDGQQDGKKAARRGEREESCEGETHSRGKGVGAGMEVGAPSHEGLQQRRGHLEYQRNDPDLGKGEAEVLFEQRVDRRNDRLHHVVEQVCGADHEENRIDGLSVRAGPGAAGLQRFCCRVHCRQGFSSMSHIVREALETSPRRMWRASCSCRGCEASR